MMPPKKAPAAKKAADEPEREFRFFDNRQKYLLFVHTCDEKEIVAKRVGEELDHITPAPPAIRVFDAGMGDGTVLTRVMREMHHRFPTMPFYIVGKEISLEDVRLSLAKMGDRFFEHPATVLVVTNLFYAEAPWLKPNKPENQGKMVWKEVALQGTTAHEFDEQLDGLGDFLVDSWQATTSPKTGNPLYEKPTALVLYREDYKFLLEDVIPDSNDVKADFDLVIASQPYRARVPAEFKAQRVLGPLTRALGPGGRLIGVHSFGEDPGLEMIRKVWPDEDPFAVGRKDIIRELKKDLGSDASSYKLQAGTDEQSVFRYEMRTLPSEVDSSIGTSTLFAAWNAAIYVAQIADERLTDTVGDRRYLDATGEVLHKRGGLWFFDESYLVARKQAG